VLRSYTIYIPFRYQDILFYHKLKSLMLQE
jgi:hypothetical protein